MPLPAQRKIGLALGGGAARGWAHIGVLEAMDQLRVPVHAVAGTSMGALVGGFFAAGRLPALTALALQLDWKQALHFFLEPAWPRAGLVDGKKIVNFVRKHVAITAIEALDLPFSAVATDLLTGREVVLARGDLIEAIRASIAIPGMFTPVPCADALLADGGLVNPLPISVVRAMGMDAVIAVDLNLHPLAGERGPAAPPAVAQPETLRWQPSGHWAPPTLVQKVIAQLARLDQKRRAAVRQWTNYRRQPTIFDIIGHSIRIMEAQITEMRLQLEPPDILIRPDLGQIGFMEFHRATAAMQAGYDAAMAQRDALLKLAGG
ncbi:MAG: patatin-like phospholipase family protein [Kiritimatiellaeota bacterium]|nr:patatin-like phospholipase family protein [Kiritimatiellota bacterium]